MIAIVGHVSRAAMVEQLAGTVSADYVTMDDGTLGCEANHRKAWSWLAANNTSSWSTVLEDDAVPVDDFTTQLDQALTAAPTPIVSLYLGKLRPQNYQAKILVATQAANRTGAAWIITTDLLHAVGVCIRTQLIPSMLTHVAATKFPSDSAITDWAIIHEHEVAYTWPSLVDHADGPTTVTHTHYAVGQVLHRDDQPRTPGRIAWWHGTRPNWNTTQVEM